MKPILICLLAVLALTTQMPAQAQTLQGGNEQYDISDQIIQHSHERSKYFVKSSIFDLGMSHEEFLKVADKSKPVVVHLHGCSGIGRDEWEIKSFYTGLGFNFVLTNFLNRGDASVSCTVSNGHLTYLGNLQTRLPARAKELVHHIDWLRANGFGKIIVTGHSEGGMIMQVFRTSVEAVIIHSMACIPTPKPPPKENRYLQLVSTNDPLLDPRRGTYPCEGRPGYENFTTSLSSVASHSPFADPRWKDTVRQFLGVQEQD